MLRSLFCALAEAAAPAGGSPVSRLVNRVAPGRALKTKTAASLTLLALGSALGWISIARSPGTEPQSESRLAVLPFSVPSAGQFSYLSEGMVDLLSRNLNGVGEQVTVDPGRVMSALRADEKRGVQGP